jgi:hypothetical protein
MGIDVARMWAGLRALDLEGSKDLTDEGCRSLMRLQGLTQLVLTECPLITAAGLALVKSSLGHCAVFAGCC